MRRGVSLQDISDGRLYRAEDWVRADAGGCQGCFFCCCHTARAIVLDPLDVARLTHGLRLSFEQLLQQFVELGMEEGLLLPHLRSEGREERCVFLNAEGRCAQHALRPGICRLFPLARYYDAQGLHYIIQKNECVKKNRKLIQVQTWIDMPQLAQYEHFVKQWHDFRIRAVQQAGGDLKGLNLYLLRVFYQTPWEEAAFYQQFATRLKQAEDDLGI